MRSFGRTWAMELRNRAIRVNVISPGPITTPFTYPAPQEWKDQMTKEFRLDGLDSLGRSQALHCFLLRRIRATSTRLN